MAILNSDGLPASKGNTLGPGGFDTAVDFDLMTGRGFVKLELPPQLIAIIENTIGHTLPDEVKQFLSTPVRMMPQEALRLGLQLITASEEAQGLAIAMRLLIEAEMNPHEAVRVVMQVSRGTREDHQLAWEQAQRLARQQQAMAGGGGDETPN